MHLCLNARGLGLHRRTDGKWETACNDPAIAGGRANVIADDWTEEVLARAGLDSGSLVPPAPDRRATPIAAEFAAAKVAIAPGLARRDDAAAELGDSTAGLMMQLSAMIRRAR
jgi:hypothetical protein